MTKIRVSKIDAAKRQLDCAIKLWFRDDDAVSIHTLTFAALTIIEDLNIKKGNTDATLLGVVKRNVKPESIEKVMKAVKEAMTFFKHANRDPNSVLTFEPVQSEGLLRFTLIGLDLLGEQLTDIQRAFFTWDLIHHPELMNLAPALVAELSKVIDFDKMRQAAKQDFFRESLLASAAIRART